MYEDISNTAGEEVLKLDLQKMEILYIEEQAPLPFVRGCKMSAENEGT